MQCTSSRILTPAPRGRTDSTAKSGRARKDARREIDFASAFEDSFPDRYSRLDSGAVAGGGQPAVSLRFPHLTVGSRMVRIALRQNATSAVFYSTSHAGISPADGRATTFRGRLVVQPGRAGKTLVATLGNVRREFVMPCTLQSRHTYGFIELDQESYRGALVITQARPGTVNVLNVIDVEEYLRGVVPLEIGRRPSEEIEALKAQAVAARTYTYKRMQERRREPFDLVATVADQVYGGSNVEYRESDLAVKLTEGLVMSYGDSLVNAYYHSTCGGSTANVEDVWEKPRCGYLRAVSDYDSQGVAFCASSAFFTWEESWSGSDLASILSRSTRDLPAERQFRGTVREIRVAERFGCGRVKLCSIAGSNGTVSFGGDKVRFMLRRTGPDNPILRSADFRVLSGGGRKIVFSGKGYGHGVGLCQMGAVGRARAGQTFGRILGTYYPGIQIRTALTK